MSRTGAQQDPAATGQAGVAASTHPALAAVLARMTGELHSLRVRCDEGRHFHATYLRTTEAVRAELRVGGFVDPAWVAQWAVAFADLYFDALLARRQGRALPGPWAVAFDAASSEGARRLPALRHVLLGMNAHINYDLPRALESMIGGPEDDDPALLARRERDHRHVDRVLVRRAGPEYARMRTRTSRARRLRWLAEPAHRAVVGGLVQDARAKAWRNARVLAVARRRGHATHVARVTELDRLATALAADLIQPGPIALRLATHGFGTLLPETESSGTRRSCTPKETTHV